MRISATELHTQVRNGKSIHLWALAVLSVEQEEPSCVSVKTAVATVSSGQWSAGPALGSGRALLSSGLAQVLSAAQQVAEGQETLRSTHVFDSQL